MWITITISRSVSSDGLLWPLCRHIHSAIWICGAVRLTCCSCLRWSLLYTFHAEHPRHLVEAGTTWNMAQRIVSITLASITIQYFFTIMLNIINWYAHSWICWYFSWAVCKYFSLICTPKSISMLIQYCYWTIFWTIWITSATTLSFIKFSFNVILPCMYLLPYQLKQLIHL